MQNIANLQESIFEWQKKLPRTLSLSLMRILISEVFSSPNNAATLLATLSRIVSSRTDATTESSPAKHVVCLSLGLRTCVENSTSILSDPSSLKYFCAWFILNRFHKTDLFKLNWPFNWKKNKTISNLIHYNNIRIELNITQRIFKLCKCHTSSKQGKCLISQAVAYTHSSNDINSTNNSFNFVSIRSTSSVCHAKTNVCRLVSTQRPN